MILSRDVCRMILDGEVWENVVQLERYFVDDYKQTPEFTDKMQSTADYNVLSAFRPYILLFWEPFKINLWHISFFLSRRLSRREDGLSVLLLSDRYGALASLDFVKITQNLLIFLATGNNVDDFKLSTLT